MSGDRRALVLVAHADDETLGAGGTLAKLAAAGWIVDVVILSDGIVTVRGHNQDNRADCTRACGLLGLQPPQFLGFPDQYFDREPIADLANAVSALQLAPNLIISHVDSDLNRDHRIVAEVARIVGRPKDRPIALLGCEIPGTTAWNGQIFAANYFVDIDATIDRKIAAFKAYGNEIRGPSHPWSEEGLRILARYHGLQSGVEYAEAFHVIRGFEGLLP